MESLVLENIPLMNTEQLHELADQWNWDDGLTVLQKIIENPQCSIGTACLIYWRGSPHYFRKFTDPDEIPFYNRENYDLLEQIEKRMAASFFQHYGIAYDPRNDEGSDFTRCKYKPPLMKRDIPACMLIFATKQGVYPFELAIS